MKRKMMLLSIFIGASLSSMELEKQYLFNPSEIPKEVDKEIVGWVFGSKQMISDTNPITEIVKLRQVNKYGRELIDNSEDVANYLVRTLTGNDGDRFLLSDNLKKSCERKINIQNERKLFGKLFLHCGTQSALQFLINKLIGEKRLLYFSWGVLYGVSIGCYEWWRQYDNSDLSKIYPYFINQHVRDSIDKTLKKKIRKSPSFKKIFVRCIPEFLFAENSYVTDWLQENISSDNPTKSLETQWGIICFNLHRSIIDHAFNVRCNIIIARIQNELFTFQILVHGQKIDRNRGITETEASLNLLRKNIKTVLDSIPGYCPEKTKYLGIFE